MSLISLNWQDKYPRQISESHIISITQKERQGTGSEYYEVTLTGGTVCDVYEEPCRQLMIEGSGFELWEVHEPEEGVLVTEDCIIRHPVLAIQLWIGIFSGITESMLPTGLWDCDTAESLMPDSPHYGRFLIVSKESKTIWMLRDRCSLTSFSTAIQMILGDEYDLSPDFMQDNTNQGLAYKVG